MYVCQYVCVYVYVYIELGRVFAETVSNVKQKVCFSIRFFMIVLNCAHWYRDREREMYMFVCMYLCIIYIYMYIYICIYFGALLQRE